MSAPQKSTVSYKRAGSWAGRCTARREAIPADASARERRRGWHVEAVRRVLCVDDNWDVAESTIELLRLVGFEAVACSDGAHALAVAPDFHPDVCLIDFNLPHMDGDELLGHLRALLAGRAVLFVAVTARGDDEARRRTAAAGFAVHLVKPVDPRDLLRVVDEPLQALEAGRRGAEPPGTPPA